MNKAGIRATILTLILVCVIYLSLVATATSSTIFATPKPVDVSVNPPKISAGESLTITFKINYQFQDQAAATVEIGSCSGCSDIWKSAQLGVYSGQSYDVHPPAITAPGSYFVTVVVTIPGPMGGAAIGGYATFKVVPSTTQTHTTSSTSQTTSQEKTTSSTTTAEAPFDFSISVSPTEQAVTPGQSAAYVVLVDLISGTSVRVLLDTQNTIAGITVSFDPPSGKPPYNSLLTVSTTQSAPPGQVAITVTGTGGGKTLTADLALIISGGQPQTTSTQNPSNSSQPNQAASLIDLIQQNSLIVLGALVVLVIIVAVVLKGGKHGPASKPTAAQSSTLCASCGTQNSPTDKFCTNCGRELA